LCCRPYGHRCTPGRTRQSSTSRPQATGPPPPTAASAPRLPSCSGGSGPPD